MQPIRFRKDLSHRPLEALRRGVFLDHPVRLRSQVEIGPKSAVRRTTETQRGARSSADRARILATSNPNDARCVFPIRPKLRHAPFTSKMDRGRSPELLGVSLLRRMHLHHSGTEASSPLGARSKDATLPQHDTAAETIKENPRLVLAPCISTNGG